MKRYIRGVGSGLPIVREYLDYSHGTISIEDNLGTGAVVTISLSSEDAGPSNSIAATRRPAGDKRRALFPWRPLCRSGNANSFPSFWGKAPWGSPIW